MNEEFKLHKLREKEILQWEDFALGERAVTTRGTYEIRNGFLFVLIGGLETRLGKFKDPKSKARSHFNDAI